MHLYCKSLKALSGFILLVLQRKARVIELPREEVPFSPPTVAQSSRKLAGHGQPRMAPHSTALGTPAFLQTPLPGAEPSDLL